LGSVEAPKKQVKKNFFSFWYQILLGHKWRKGDLLAVYCLLTQDVIACTTAIRSCEMLGHWSAGLQILEFMPSVQITPDAWRWLGKAGEVKGHKKHRVIYRAFLEGPLFSGLGCWEAPG